MNLTRTSWLTGVIITTVPHCFEVWEDRYFRQIHCIFVPVDPNYLYSDFGTEVSPKSPASPNRKLFSLDRHVNTRPHLDRVRRTIPKRFSERTTSDITG